MTESRLELDNEFFSDVFEADINNIRRIVPDVFNYYENVFGSMDDRTSLELKVILNELLINAIKHGGREGASHSVRLIAGMARGDCAFIIVEDDGEGYDTAGMGVNRAVAPTTGRIDEIEETGRGIYIVKKLCDDFMVNEKGNKVVVLKNLTGDFPE